MRAARPIVREDEVRMPHASISPFADSLLVTTIFKKRR